jgi:hypothetical protein
MGLQRSGPDSNLYYFVDQGQIVILLLYVKDMYLTGNHVSKLTWLRQRLTQTYDMTDMGTLCHSLGLEFLYSPSDITIT